MGLFRSIRKKSVIQRAFCLIASFSVFFTAFVDFARPSFAEQGDFLNRYYLRVFGYVPTVALSGMEVVPNGLDFSWENLDGFDVLRANSEVEKKINVGYFLTALSIKSENIWVNLDVFLNDLEVADPLIARTDLAKALLYTDLELKRAAQGLLKGDIRLAESFVEIGFNIAPERDAWDFNPRFWIVPGNIELETAGNMVRIRHAELDVMCEVASGGQDKDQAEFDKRIEELIKAEILPELKKIVNADRRFLFLRQAYNAVVLAEWYKGWLENQRAMMHPFSGFVNTNNVEGMTSFLGWSRREFLDRFLEMYNSEGGDEVDSFGYNILVGGVGPMILDGKVNETPAGEDYLAKAFNGGKPLSVRLIKPVAPVVFVTGILLNILMPESAFAAGLGIGDLFNALSNRMGVDNAMLALGTAFFLGNGAYFLYEWMRSLRKGVNTRSVLAGAEEIAMPVLGEILEGVDNPTELINAAGEIARYEQKQGISQRVSGLLSYVASPKIAGRFFSGPQTEEDFEKMLSAIERSEAGKLAEGEISRLKAEEGISDHLRSALIGLEVYNRNIRGPHADKLFIMTAWLLGRLSERESSELWARLPRFEKANEAGRDVGGISLDMVVAAPVFD